MDSQMPGKVAHNEDRLQQPFRFLNGRFDCKVSSAETLGGLCVFDTVRSEPGGPPLHLHHGQDEWFCVTEGRFLVQVGTEMHELGPGDSILGPRGIPHAFRNVSETGRLLVIFQPAGTMEEFFRRGSEKGPMSPAEFSELSSLHGMTVVGPPL